MRHARTFAQKNARKTGGCQRVAPRAFSTGANSPETGENTAASRPSQQPSPRRTDATEDLAPVDLEPVPSRSSLHQEEPMPLLCALWGRGAWLARSSLHQEEPMPLYKRADVDAWVADSQQPSPRRTDATSNPARTASRTTPRSSLHQEEPMPLGQPSLRARIPALAAAFTKKNRCHPSGRAGLAPHCSGPLAAAFTKKNRCHEQMLQCYRDNRRLAAAFTKKNRCHSRRERGFLRRAGSQQPSPRRTDATDAVRRSIRPGDGSQQPSPRRTDATGLAVDRAALQCRLAAAFTKKNRCHLGLSFVSVNRWELAAAFTTKNRCHVLEPLTHTFPTR